MSDDGRWNLAECMERLRTFRDERDWAKFHSPKNLAAAIAIEAGELQERFLWKNDAASEHEALSAEERAAVESELADVLIFGLYLADRLGTDARRVVLEKIAENQRRYDVEGHAGVARKAPSRAPQANPPGRA